MFVIAKSILKYQTAVYNWSEKKKKLEMGETGVKNE